MNLSNFRIGTRLLASFGFITMLTLILGMVAFTTLSDVGQKWGSFQGVTLQKSLTASQGRAALTDGVQQFKDYVLRGQDYDHKFIADMDDIDKAVSAYRAISRVSAGEKDALDRIANGVADYREAIKKAVAMKADGRSIEDIDKAIKGADKPISAVVELM